MKTKQLLEDLGYGNSPEAFEAAKSLSSLPRLPTKRIIEGLNHTKNISNRVATVYALSWLHRKNNTEVLQALIKIASDAKEDPSVRGQAFEGLGIQKSGPRSKLWHEIE